MNWILRFWENRNALGGIRSPQWGKTRNDFIKKNPLCAVCGRKSSLLKPNEIHHKKVFHLNPQLELDESNLITLCRQDHYEWGHLFSWKSWNESVEEDAKVWRDKVAKRP